jgi:hypothetical protein
MTARRSLLLFPLAAFLFLGADAADRREADKEALAPLQAYVGAWRGAGQIRRGSTEGAWTEQSEWAWKFSEKGAALAFTAATPKYLASGTLSSAGKPNEYKLVAKTASGKQELTYRGKLEDGRLLLTADSPSADQPARISIRVVAAGDRLVMLYERQSGTADNYARLAEVGYTRKDSTFGKGTSEIECIVTGGKGTIAVMHKGQTYYVCCTGCRDLFTDDPEGVLADFRARKAAEKEQKK